MLLVGLVVVMGASTSASEALSSSSFTTNSKAFTKHNGFGHFQEKANGSKAPEVDSAEKNGKINSKKVPVVNNDIINKNLRNKKGHSDHPPNDKHLDGQKLNGHKPSSSSVPTHDPDPPLETDFIADTKLPTDVGQFQLRAYRVRNSQDEAAIDPEAPYQNTNALEPVVIYSTNKPPFGKDGKLAENVPIRIHDQCLTSEVFRSQRYVPGF